MYYALAYILGGLTVYAVYTFNLQPKLKKERDDALAALKAKTGI